MGTLRVSKILEIASVLCNSFCDCFRGCRINLVFLVYSIGDALLDATLRPNVPQIVCYSLYPKRLSHCRHLELHMDIEDDVQKEATTYLILHKILTNAPALVLGMFCGAWSDRHGRKLPMIMPSLGTTFAVLLYMGANMSKEASVAYFLVGSFLHGCFGKTAMISMAVNSFVVDITETDKRTKKLGTLAAMQFLGMFVGSLFGGILIEKTNILTTYCCVSIMNALVVILALGILKESIPVDHKTDLFPCRYLCQGKNVTDSLLVLHKKRTGNTRKNILGLFLVLILHQTCRTGLTDVTLLFTEMSPLSWPTSWFGYLSALDNAAMGLVLLFLLPILSSVLKLSDVVISILGLACACIRFAILAWSNKSWMVWFAVIVGSFGGIINSPMRSLLSKLVHEDEVGKMFSLLGSGETIAKFFAVIFTYLYGTTLDLFPGFTFIIAAVLYFIMIVITLVIQFYIKKDQEISENDGKLEMNHINHDNAKPKDYNTGDKIIQNGDVENQKESNLN